jgi:aspartate carbamoyltransferase catalytic subunit
MASAASSSSAKGESVADTAKVVSCYADIIVMRHPKEGAAYVAAENADVPVINAGDGGHCHPTQTLADLLTIELEKNRLSDMTIGLCGDLKFGRTVHSLINAMSRYENIRFCLISPDELKLPDYVVKDVLEKKNIEFWSTSDLEDAIPKLDILYMTRVQKERFFNEEDYLRLKDSYILTPDKLVSAKPDLSVMHPLPRVNEISTAVDKDPRACYFKQVLNGKYMRMALILKLLKEAGQICM